MIKNILVSSTLVLGFALNVLAQQDIATSSTLETKLEPVKTSFKLKSELRSSVNGFSDKTTTTNFRLRLDPSWAREDIVIGLRQDIKNRISLGTDAYIVDNTRSYVGKNYKINDWQIQPRVEAWLPTNVMDRDTLSYQGSPGAAVKVKRKWLNVTSNYEFNGKRMLYQNSKNNYADWVMFNELKNEIRLSKQLYGNLNAKFDDSWDQAGNRTQRYSLEQSLAIKIEENLDIEVGHAIEKATLAKNKGDSFVGYDKDLSQVYSAVNYVY